MLGTIRIQDLELSCIIGIYPEERINIQPLFLDIEMDIDISKVTETGSISHTIDYAEISQMITTWILEKQFLLIENVAEGGCRLICSTYSQVIRCKLEVKKPKAIQHASYVSVTVEYFRDNI